jgi:hypothetical protein
LAGESGPQIRQPLFHAAHALFTQTRGSEASSCAETADPAVIVNPVPRQKVLTQASKSEQQTKINTTVHATMHTAASINATKAQCSAN